MNLFQKDLSLFQDKMMKNRQLYENVKQEKEKKEEKKINLGLEIYDNDSKIANYQVLKNKRLRANKKIKNLKQSRALIMAIVVVVSLGAFGSIAFFNLMISLASIPVFSGLVVLIKNIYNTKINAIVKERNAFSDNKSFKELNKIIDNLVKENNIRKTMQKDLENEIKLLSDNLEKIDSDASKIHESYKFILDVYQDALGKVDTSVSDEELEQLVNNEHANVMPVMIKKLFDRKNV